jgi:hypothetical protein
MKKRIGRPSPATIIAVVALVFALTGTAVGAKKLLGLGAFKDGVKNKTVGVGKLTYVTSTTTDDNADPAPKVVVATCPGNFEAIGGGIKSSDPLNDPILDSYPTTSGWTGHVSSAALPATPTTFTTTAICARSRAITGAPPSS